MSSTTFDAIKIGIASPDIIREWSHGEVKKPETINYRTLKPERDGLFCERIFGPTKDWECHCGKYKKIRYKGKICDRCGVEVTRAKVRRERMGHIELAAPVSHIWYFKGIPSRMGLILDISPRILEKLLYFACYVVIDPGPAYTGLTRGQTLTEREYRDYREKYEDDFKAGMGAEAVKELLSQIDCEALSVELRNELKEASGQKKAKIVKRLEVVEAFRQSGNRPEWMILDVLPVIPPDIRPMVQLDGGRFATSDLNDLYRRVINRNNRLKKLIQLNAPDIIVRNEKRMLQEAVDALIDNGRRGRAVTGVNSRVLKSLSDMLKGKQGRFRQNLLGKRVDYSGRSVIVVGPDLKLFQCGVPKEMAIELFRPFVMKKLVEDGVANNIKSAKKMVDKGKTEVWDALEDVIKEHPVLLNRAPTLHRLGIQAFEPILVEGRALKLHPLVCTAYNADFDGDQMAIHVPLSAEAQAEARILMLSANNLLRPQDGHPVTVPTQDMIMGAYYLTYEREEVYVTSMGDCFHTEMREGKCAPLDLVERLNAEAEAAGKQPITYTKREYFSSEEEAMMAYDNGLIGMHAPIHVRVFKEKDGGMQHRTVKTTVGRIIYNEPIPQDLGFVDRSDPDKYFDYEINFKVDKKKLGNIVDRCITRHGFTRSTEVLDAIKAMGFKYSTLGALTISISDMTVPEKKKTLIKETEQKVVDIEKQYKRGFITNDERARLVISEWDRTTSAVTAALESSLNQFNPIYMMSDSGARGSMNQIRQLAGMRGLIANTAGRTIEIPIKANYREGLSVLEYFTSSRGARKGLADTALRTADSGYLTRRLVDVSQDVIIREEDCGTKDGTWAYALTKDYFVDFDRIMKDEHFIIGESSIWKNPENEMALPFEEDTSGIVRSFGDAIHGRFPVYDILDPVTGEVLCDEKGVFTRDRMLLSDDAKVFMAHKIVAVRIRSVLDCEAKRGVCSRCYGMNLATGEPVSAGEAVGVIAAQSIGEPGTQLTMRTFHTGGVAGDDITQGLPRVEELFEARKPKKMTTLAEISGVVTIEDAKKANMINLSITGLSDATDTVSASGERWTVLLPNTGIRVKNGDTVMKGDKLTDGQYSPHDVLRVLGLDAAHLYLTQEVQKVYRQQGVDINDKHIEVIVRQLMRKARVEEAGDTDLLSGATVELTEVKEKNREIRRENERLEAAGEVPLRPATYTRLLMGITKASLATESFLSAASFQETTKVLTEAAIKGKVDHLVGLKENVIIGKLIPAGSGLSMYRDFDLKQVREEAGLADDPDDGMFAPEDI